MSDLEQLQVLCSHKQTVKQLVFSPWPVEGGGVDGNPLVLVSLAEQVCFWDIKYVINNPLDNMKKKNNYRRSSRFSKEIRWHLNGEAVAKDNDINGNGVPITTNGKTVPGDSNTVDVVDGRVGHGDYWSDKTGASDKPELLACIKFVGSATKLVTNKEFTKFITIDNEGDIYALETCPVGSPASSSGESTPVGNGGLLMTPLTNGFRQMSMNTLTIPSS